MVLQFCRNGAEELGSLKWEPFDIEATDISNEEELNENIKSLINDNGFGCQSIMGAYIVLSANYSNKDVCIGGIKIHVKDYYLNKDVKETPQRYIDLAEDTCMRLCNESNNFFRSSFFVKIID